MTTNSIPQHLLQKAIGSATRDELLEAVEAMSDGGIRVDFSGKTTARRLVRLVRPRIANPVVKYGYGSSEERAANLLIEGDNLQTMATLYRERGQVDLILTDPPYNTGKDFRYNDKWDNDPNDLGIGKIVAADDGARHTKWMKFMWPRLQVMKEMLGPSGVLAICIDHRELFRLGQMLDELFDEKNRIAIINWQRAATRRNDKGQGKAQGKGAVSVATEFILVYANDRTLASTALDARSSDAGYKNPDDDPKGDWVGVGPWAPGASTHPGMVYAIQNPFTGLLQYPPGTQCHKSEKKSVHAALEEWGSKYVELSLNDGCAPALVLKGCKSFDPLLVGEDPAVRRAAKRARERLQQQPQPWYYFSKQGLGRPRQKTYLKDVPDGFVPTTYWADDDWEDDELFSPGAVSLNGKESGTTEIGSRELTSIVGDGHGYETVKPLKLFEKVIQLWCPSTGIVLDPFAGSGTTGHAVLNLNEDTGTTRSFILIEQGRPERGDSYARTLTADRLQRVCSGDWASGSHEALPGGFQFASLGKKVDATALLAMARDELRDTVISSHFDRTRSRGDKLIQIDGDYRYLVAQNSASEGFFLVWDGPEKNTDITEEVYYEIVAEAKRRNLSDRAYHVYARLFRFQSDDVAFYRIPDRILADFGLDTRSEPFNEVDGE